MGLLDRIKRGLKRTREAFATGFHGIFRGALDEDKLEEIEDALLSADVGVTTTDAITAALRKSWKEKQFAAAEQALPALKRALAKYFRDQDKKVVLGAGDTFRAAAVEQLTIWSERLGVEIVKQAAGADPAAVAYDAVEAAVARNADVLIIDTAGRLHTQDNLMRELEKIRRVIGKRIPDAPHETLLVLDATTGQNAVQQARMFHEAAPVTGLFLAKLDGTAKGGAVQSIRDV